METLCRCDIVNVDITKSLIRSYVGKVLATGDCNANKYGVNVFRDGELVDLTGYSVQGYFIRPDMDTLVLIGAAEGNTAYVILPQACYTSEGAFSLAIKISGNGVTHTVRVVDGHIRQTRTDNLVDPGEAIPSLDDLFAQIAAMEAATAEANSAADDARAAAAANETRTNVAIERVNKTLGDALAEVAEAAENAAPAIRERKSGAMAAVPDAAARSALSVQSAIEHVQSGTGDPSPDNVRPINGWDAVTLDRTGANLLGGMHLAEILREQAGATIDTSAGTVRFSADNLLASPALIRNNPFKPGQVYTVILYGRNVNTNYPATNIAVGYTDGTYIPLSFPSSGADAYAVHHTAAGKTVRSIFAISAAGETILYYGMCGVFEGAVTADTMIPSRGMRLSAALPETVYGGTLDWTNGLLTVTHHKITFDGVTVGAMVDETDPGATTYAYINGWNMSKPVKNGGNAYPNKIRSASTSTVLAFGLPRELTGVTDTDNATTVVSKYNAVLKQWYDAGEPLEIVYEIATPYTIQLDPQTLPLLQGLNNAWSDTGDTTVNYIADTKLYIDGKFDELQNAILAQGANI